MMFQPLRYVVATLPIWATVMLAAAQTMPAAQADNDNNTLISNNKRLNYSVVANVYTVQHQAGCTNITISPQLQLAAQRHPRDVLNNRALVGDIGSDGSTVQDRANDAGFEGVNVAETVAINRALAISGIEILGQWYHNPDYLAIMQDCAHTAMGVWSENSLDRTVVVAVYGYPTG